MTGMRLHRQRHIVERGEIEKQRGDLERTREPERAAPMHRQRGDVATVKADRARVWCNLAGELSDQRGLAGAVRADDGMQLARRNGERDAVGGHNATEALGETFDREQRISHGACPPGDH